MPIIKTNAATVSSQRQAPGSETNPNQGRRMVPDEPIHNVRDDATRLAISVRTAAPSDPAEAPIEDADAARATAELIRSQILEQPDTAILAQANALPDHVLALLRD